VSSVHLPSGVMPLSQHVFSAFPFEQTIRDIHTELVDLHEEAAVLVAKIQENFEEVGI
jgi:type I restriction enzyme M protein